MQMVEILKVYAHFSCSYTVADFSISRQFPEEAKAIGTTSDVFGKSGPTLPKFPIKDQVAMKKVL